MQVRGGECSPPWENQKAPLGPLFSTEQKPSSFWRRRANYIDPKTMWRSTVKEGKYEKSLYPSERDGKESSAWTIRNFLHLEEGQYYFKSPTMKTYGHSICFRLKLDRPLLLLYTTRLARPPKLSSPGKEQNLKETVGLIKEVLETWESYGKWGRTIISSI